jgi:hypothetical protein
MQTLILNFSDPHLALRIGYYKLYEEEEKKGKRYSEIMRTCLRIIR